MGRKNPFLKLAADSQHLIEISQGGALSVLFFPLFLIRLMIALLTSAITILFAL